MRREWTHGADFEVVFVEHQNERRLFDGFQRRTIDARSKIGLARFGPQCSLAGRQCSEMLFAALWRGRVPNDFVQLPTDTKDER